MSIFLNARGAPPPLALARRLCASLGPQALRTILLTTTFLVLGAWLAAARDGRAQSTTPPDVLAALLIEVRGLRAAMEQMASAGPRVQLALGRLQLQEQRVNTMVRRLEEVKASLAATQRRTEEMTDRLIELERGAREASDPVVRSQTEEMSKELKAELTRATADVRRLQGEEAALSQDISAEQGRWAEINQRLEDLERSLGRR
jgi:chromosome segregation ATPase